jgi:hypothetical protein
METKTLLKVRLSLLLIALLSTVTIYAQVGINTSTPEGALDINSSTNGFVPPRVALTTTTAEAPVVNPQGGSIPTGTVVWNTATAGTSPTNVVPGLYYWNGSSWIGLAGAPGGLEWSITGNAGTNTTSNFIGTTDANGLMIRTNNTNRFEYTNGGQLHSYADGTAASPLYSWNSDQDTGLYRIGADQLGAAAGGSLRMRVSTNGVYGVTADANSYGIQGENTSSSGTGAGVYGLTATASGYGVVGENSGNNNAVHANGNLTASGTKPFMIDHPEDPENKYLKHFSIESDEVLNIYRGIEAFDANGKATVALPSYYNSINKNASYQLTPVGASMPNLYIESEVTEGVFVIAGGIPGNKVSWQLTAERNDPYLKQNPEERNVELDKGLNRGKYFMPELYNQPKEKGIFYKKDSKKK